MDGNDDKLAVVKEYMQDMEKTMYMWFHMKQDLYVKLSSILISLSVAAIGFAAAYMLENRYYSGKYETSLALSGLWFQFLGLFSLLISGFCGLMHLEKNLAFVQGTEKYFDAHFKVAAKMYYEKNSVAKPEQDEKFTSPSPGWWNWQLCLLKLGIAFLSIWIAIDFFIVVGSP